MFFKRLILVAIPLFCLGCNSTKLQRDLIVSAYQQGDLTLSEAELTHTIERQGAEVDYTKSNDAVWLLLDRATLRFSRGDADGAIADYRAAIDALDYYGQQSPIELLGKTLCDDTVGAYQAADYEQLLARIYFALALLHQGDSSNAFAILRQGEELQQRKKEIYSSTSFTKHYRLVDNPVAKYLFAALLENRGDKSNAEIIYKQTEQLLGRPVKQGTPSKDTATLIVICHNGNVPQKVTTFSEGSVASAMALEILLSSQCIDPAISSLTGIPVPAFRQTLASCRRPTYIAIDDADEEMIEPWFNVSAAASYNLQQEMPVIVARGVARLLLRRSAVAYAQEQDPGLGMLADLGALIANANSQADTRSWGFLPNTIDLARYELPSGSHTLAVSAESFGRSSFYARVPITSKA